jgi:hypothetical protein
MTTPQQELESAERSHHRVRAELEALSVAELSPLNVDVVSAASVALGVAERVRSLREQMARLPGFDLRHVDNLVDYARATWFAAMKSPPGQGPAPQSTDELALEVAALRAKLLMWATPLVGSGFFEEADVARVKAGSGLTDWPSDLAALQGLFGARWEEVKSICGVTAADLERASRIGPELLARLSRREYSSPSPRSDGALRVQRAWTLLDRAYGHCRRAVWYLHPEDLSLALPSLHGSLRPATPFNESSSSAPPPAADAAASDSSIPTLISAVLPSSGLRTLDAGVPFGADP